MGNIEFLKRPSRFAFFLMKGHGLLDKLDDESYLKWTYYVCTEKQLNLKEPRTFNEKLNWLKLLVMDLIFHIY